MNITMALYSTSGKIETVEILAVLSIHWCACEVDSYKIMLLAPYPMAEATREDEHPAELTAAMVRVGPQEEEHLENKVHEEVEVTQVESKLLAETLKMQESEEEIQEKEEELKVQKEIIKDTTTIIEEKEEALGIFYNNGQMIFGKRWRITHTG